MTNKRYEICTYQFGEDAEGNHSHIENVENPVKTGWTVYVREYTPPDDSTWEEVYDEDFESEAQRDYALSALKVKYPDAEVDSY